MDFYQPKVEKTMLFTWWAHESILSVKQILRNIFTNLKTDMFKWKEQRIMKYNIWTKMILSRYNLMLTVQYCILYLIAYVILQDVFTGFRWTVTHSILGDKKQNHDLGKLFPLLINSKISNLPLHCTTWYNILYSLKSFSPLLKVQTILWTSV